MAAGLLKFRICGSPENLSFLVKTDSVCSYRRGKGDPDSPTQEGRQTRSMFIPAKIPTLSISSDGGGGVTKLMGISVNHNISSAVKGRILRKCEQRCGAWEHYAMKEDYAKILKF